MAHKSIVRPSMEYACAVWNPHTEKDHLYLESDCQMDSEKLMGSKTSEEMDKALQRLCIDAELAILVD